MHAVPCGTLVTLQLCVQAHIFTVNSEELQQFNDRTLPGADRGRVDIL